MVRSKDQTSIFSGWEGDGSPVLDPNNKGVMSAMNGPINHYLYFRKAFERKITERKDLKISFRFDKTRILITFNQVNEIPYYNIQKGNYLQGPIFEGHLRKIFKFFRVKEGELISLDLEKVKDYPLTTDVYSLEVVSRIQKHDPTKFDLKDDPEQPEKEQDEDPPPTQ